MRVPAAASMETDKSKSFEASLEAASPPDRDEPIEAAKHDETADAPREEPQAPDDEARAADRTPDQTDSEQGDPGESPQPVRSLEPTESTRGAPARQGQATADKGAGAPLTSKTVGSGDLAAGTTNEAGSLATKAQSVDLRPADAANASVKRPVLTDSLAKLSSTMPKHSAVPASATTAGYRTMNAQSVRMVEHARDSVFKQILFKLGKETGEMRIRLDPPELGELDLRMQMDRSGNLRLSIGAERTDLREMLLSNLAELQRSLQQNGLQVSHTEVRTGSDQRRGNDEPSSNESPISDELHDVEGAQTKQGYFTAQGLDFWV